MPEPAVLILLAIEPFEPTQYGLATDTGVIQLKIGDTLAAGGLVVLALEHVEADHYGRFTEVGPVPVELDAQE